MVLELSNTTGKLKGDIRLTGSKSITNRVLIIQHLTEAPFSITNGSDSKDTRVLREALTSKEPILDLSDAGTGVRFITALLAATGRSATVTGSVRMQERPIKPLVDALNRLGCRIEYLGNPGCPPIKIHPARIQGKHIDIDSSVSSQFITALLLVAPVIPGGLSIRLTGEAVSTSYIDMTTDIMRHFGAEIECKDNTYVVKEKPYAARDFAVESDWSSAGYLFACASFSSDCNVTVQSLHEKSSQPDAGIRTAAESFGVKFRFEDGRLSRTELRSPAFMEMNFLNTPDMAQTIAVMAAGHGSKALFSGLDTLSIKETDRIAALRKELARFGYVFTKVPQRFTSEHAGNMYMLDGTYHYNGEAIHTYGDHRMAMAFAPLAMLQPLRICDAEVVEKSYPAFFDDLANIGFNVKNTTS